MIKQLDNINLIKQIYNLETLLFYNPYTYQQLIDMYNDSNYHFYIFINDSNNEILGYAIILLLESEMELIKIGVNNNAQNRGIGSQLINYLKEFNLPIFLEVNAININAINFYKFHNFKLIQTRKKYYKDNNDALIFKYMGNKNV